MKFHGVKCGFEVEKWKGRILCLCLVMGDLVPASDVVTDSPWTLGKLNPSLSPQLLPVKWKTSWWYRGQRKGKCIELIYKEWLFARHRTRCPNTFYIKLNISQHLRYCLWMLFGHNGTRKMVLNQWPIRDRKRTNTIWKKGSGPAVWSWGEKSGQDQSSGSRKN